MKKVVILGIIGIFLSFLVLNTLFGSTYTHISGDFYIFPDVLSSRGITTNGSDFWIVDSSDDYVYHFDAEGNNVSAGDFLGFDISLAGSTFAMGITTNNSDFWVVDWDNDYVYHFDAEGNNVSAGDFLGFDISLAGSDTPGGITTNGSDFWVVDYTDDYVYHFDAEGNNVSVGDFLGFDISLAGSTNARGITMNDSDFWIADSTNEVFHLDGNGTDVGDGFSTLGVSSNLEGITTNSSNNQATDFWVIDLINHYVYHYGITPLGTILNTPQNNSFNNTLTIDFNCSSEEGDGILKNVTLYIWNSTTAELVNNSVTEIKTGYTNESNFTIVLPINNTYEWNCYSCDTNHKCVFAGGNFTLTLDLINPELNITLPTNNSIDLLPTQNINFTSYDINSIDSCWYSNDTLVVNTSITGCTNLTTATWTRGLHNVTIWVNDSASNENRSDITFTVDNINPEVSNISITTVRSSQTITFSFNATDTNLDSCWYSIFNSSGGIDSATTENASVTCNSAGNSETLSAFATYNLTIYANDSAGNENSTSQSFTLLVGIGGGGGGGGSPSQVIKIAIKQPKNTTKQSDLQRAIIFSRMFETCGDVPEMIGKCELSLFEKEGLLQNLSEQTVKMELEELNIWLKSFNNYFLEEVQLFISDAEKYDLFVGVLREGAIFKVEPSRLDKYFFILSDKPILKTTIKSNRILEEVSVVSGDLDLKVEIVSDTIAELTLEPINLDFSSRLFNGVISYTDEKGDTTYQDIQIRAINFLNKFTLLFIGIVILFIATLIFFRKGIKNLAKKTFKKLK